MTIVQIRRSKAGGHAWDAWEAAVSFSYDPDLVEIIRSVPGRRWEPEKKTWWIPEGETYSAASLFVSAGAVVFIDGERWHAPAREKKQEPPPRVDPPPKAGKNPFLPFFAALPEYLRMPAWKALQKVVHPDVGGDVKLSQQLNDARPEKVA